MAETDAGLPFLLRAEGPQVTWRSDGDLLAVEAPPRSDLFVDPAVAPPHRDAGALPDAPRLLGVPTGDFQLAARVGVDFRATFDAGVLVLHRDAFTWAKLCFEYTPQGTPSVVSVVTRGTSDDANAVELTEPSAWLRVSRTGRAFAFHASTDGRWWRLIRYFGLDDPTGPADASTPVRVGFLAQSPTGEGCAVTFDEITFTPHAPADLRDGT